MSTIDTPQLTIDGRAIVNNYRTLCQQAKTQCGAVIKAQMYGTKSFESLQKLVGEGCKDFFVATAQEAEDRLDLPADARVYVFNSGPPTSRGVKIINSLMEASRAASIDAIHIDTGMNRFGLSPDDVAQLDVSKIKENCLILTQFVESEVPDSIVTLRQINLYRSCVASIRSRLPAGRSIRTSIANSAGIFVPGAQSDLPRPGYALYGGNPTPWTQNPMNAVVKLEAPIAQVRRLKSGDRVGYLGTWQAETECWAATVPIGYADGWLRSGSNQVIVEYQQNLMASVGRISMDSMVINTGNIEPKVGDRVVLISDHPELSIDSVASRAGTIGYEMLTSLGNRYQRRYC